MKLQRQLSKRTKNKDYFRYNVHIQDNIITEAGFKEGDELDAEVKKGEIKLKKI